MRTAGVPYVVCWQTRVHDRAARLLAASFFVALSSGRSYEQVRSSVHRARPSRPFAVLVAVSARSHLSLLAFTTARRRPTQAFEHAKSALKLATRPGRLASGVPSSVPLFEIRDPFGPPSSAAPTFTPPPQAAGIPLLLCEATLGRERAISGDS